MAVHLSGDPTAFAGRLRTLASAVDPELRVDDPISLDQADRATLAAYDAWFRVVVVAGVLAMLLTNAGIFSIISYTVARRTREIGVRVALGADRRQVVTAVAGRMARLVATGVLAGSVLLALLVFAASEGTLEPTPTRGALLLAHMLVMTLVCLLACVVPTRRALKIEPAEALAADG
jgi:ABC-type antimicrobial peptide transport system permease subunit